MENKQRLEQLIVKFNRYDIENKKAKSIITRQKEGIKRFQNQKESINKSNLREIDYDLFVVIDTRISKSIKRVRKTIDKNIEIYAHNIKKKISLAHAILDLDKDMQVLDKELCQILIETIKKITVI